MPLPRLCPRCNVKFTPTGRFQKLCKFCQGNRKGPGFNPMVKKKYKKESN